MRKEILTTQAIKKDILSLLKADIAGIFASYALFLMLDFTLSLPLRYLGITFPLGFLLFAVLTVSALLLLLYTFIRIQRTRKCRFSLKTDVLVKKKATRRTLWSGYKPYTLYFGDRPTKYSVPARINYKWSSLYDMNEKGVYNYSDPGDEFLLVTLGGKEIIMVYNLKLFDFRG